MLVRDFNARVGKAGQPDGIIGQYGEKKRDTDGVEMVKFRQNNESTKARSTMDMG